MSKPFRPCSYLNSPDAPPLCRLLHSPVARRNHGSAERRSQAGPCVPGAVGRRISFGDLGKTAKGWRKVSSWARWPTSSRECQSTQGAGCCGVSGLGHRIWYVVVMDSVKTLDLMRTSGSDVLRLNVIGMNLIVLNTMEAAVDLLDKRSSIYSDR